MYSIDDPEAFAFAVSISGELGIAGWHPSLGRIVSVKTTPLLRSAAESVGGSPGGVTIVTNRWDSFPWETQKPLQALMDAFRECGPFWTSGTVDPKLKDDEARIVVGAR
jgi:hypothetical protein